MVVLTFVDVQAKGEVDESGVAHFSFEDTGVRAKDIVESIYCPSPECDFVFDNPWEFLNLACKREGVSCDPV